MANVDDEAPDGDGIGYVTYAYNLARYETFSIEEATGGETPAADAEREPAYPFFLAAGLRAWADAETISVDCLLHGEEACGDLRRLLKLWQAPILFAVIMLVYAAGRYLTGRPWLPILAVALVLFQEGFYQEVGRYRSELLAGLFLVGHGYASARLLTADRKGWWAAASGLSLGLLILTKALYLFYPIILTLALIAGTLWRGFRRAIPLRPAALAIAIAVLLTAIWFARNAVVLDKVYFTGRGGGVLSVRAELTTMTWSELAAGFVYFAPFAGKKLADDLLEPAQYERLDWRNPDSYRKRAVRGMGEVKRTQQAMAGSPFTNYLAPLTLMAENWPKQIALTGLALYRGLAVQSKVGRRLGRPLVSLSNLSIAISVAIIPALLVAAFVAVRRRAAAEIAFFMPAVYAVLFLAFLTHFNPRFGMPLVPIGAVALSWLAGLLLDRRRRTRAVADGTG